MSHLEIMTPYEVMVRPLIERALENRDFNYLHQIKNGDIFSGHEIVSVLLPMKELDDIYVGTNHKASQGDCCKLYKRCSNCLKDVWYKHFMYGDLNRWRKNRVCWSCSERDDQSPCFI